MPETIRFDDLVRQSGPDVIRMDDLTQQQPMPSATGWLRSLPGRMIEGGVAAARGLHDQLSAATQRTSPVVEDAAGNPNYRALGRLTQFDYGYGFLDQNGRDNRFDPTRHVALRDPRTGEMTVYERNQQTEEGALSSTGRMLGFGLLTSPTTRLASAGAASRGQSLARDMEQIGVTPNLPTVAQNRVVSTTAQALRNTPVASAPIERGLNQAVGESAAAADRIAGEYGISTTPREGGQAIQRGAQQFAARRDLGDIPASEIIASPTGRVGFPQKADALYSRVSRHFTDADMVPATSTMATLDRLSGQFPNAPALARILENRTFPQMRDAMAGGELSFPELQRLRSRVGAMMGDGGLRDDIPRGDLRALYRAISQDLESAAQARGPEALRDFQRANRYYSLGVERIDRALDAVSGGSAEQAMQTVSRMGGSRGGADLSSLRAIVRSMPNDERGEVAAAWIRNAGRPTPGAADPLANANWSPSTFVTNYERLSPEARNVLFDGAGMADARRLLDALVRVSAAQRNVDRLRNTSNSANVGIAGVMGAAAYADPINTALGVLGARAASELMMRPSFVRWLIAARTAEPSQLPQMIARIRAVGQLERQAAPAYSEFADQLQRIFRPAPAQSEDRQ